MMDMPLSTSRLLIRDWSLTDAETAAAVYGPEVTRWLTLATEYVQDAIAMQSVLQNWVEAQRHQLSPCGRWAIERRGDGMVIGGLVIRLLPPHEQDLELSGQLRPQARGHGYATEAARALLTWAFTQDSNELFAMMRPDNTHAIATAERLGMSRVDDTPELDEQHQHVYRIRPADLTISSEIS